MQNDLISLGEDLFANPIPVKIPNIPDAKTYWNWFTRELFLFEEHKKHEYEVRVGDWILKFKEAPIFSVMNNEDFKKYADSDDLDSERKPLERKPLFSWPLKTK